MSEEKKPLMAEFRPQVWSHDYAMPAGDVVPFDATMAFLSLSAGEARTLKDGSYGTDNLASDVPARAHHAGPFEVDADIDNWLEDNGIDGRSSITEESWTTLREAYGWKEPVSVD